LKPALTVHHGAATPRPSGILDCLIACAYWDRAEATAFRAFIAADYGDDFARATEQLRAAQAERESADLRLRRAELEASGRGWLEVCK
jgi:hypothetical protein